MVPTSWNAVVYGLLIQHMAFDWWVRINFEMEWSDSSSDSIFLEAKTRRFILLGKRSEHSFQIDFSENVHFVNTFQARNRTKYLLFINFWKYARRPASIVIIASKEWEEKNIVRRKGHFVWSSCVPRRNGENQKRLSFSINIRVAHWFFSRYTFSTPWTNTQNEKRNLYILDIEFCPLCAFIFCYSFVRSFVFCIVPGAEHL